MKSEMIRVRIQPDRVNDIKKAAAELGLNVSEFIRMAAAERAKKELRGVKNG